jgi:pimeloyl-ACP methyl ester carboxylesterase
VRHLARPLLFRFFARASRTKALVGGYGSPALDQLLAEAHGQVPPDVMAARVRATLTVDVRSELADCTVPILYLAATRDFVVPRTNLRRIQRQRADVTTRLIDGPHLALATNPRDSARAIEEFCDTIA